MFLLLLFVFIFQGSYSIGRSPKRRLFPFFNSQKIYELKFGEEALLAPIWLPPVAPDRPGDFASDCLLALMMKKELNGQ